MSKSMKGRCHMEERHGWENNIKVNDMYVIYIYMRACTDSGLGFVGLLCSRQRTYMSFPQWWVFMLHSYGLCRSSLVAGYQRFGGHGGSTCQTARCHILNRKELWFSIKCWGNFFLYVSDSDSQGLCSVHAVNRLTSFDTFWFSWYHI